MLDQIKNTTEYIKRIIGDFQPEYGIILGTGLGAVVDDIDVEYELTKVKLHESDNPYVRFLDLLPIQNFAQNVIFLVQ